MAWKLSRLIISWAIIFGVVGKFSEALNCGNDPCRCDVSESEYLNISPLKANLTVGNLSYCFYGCKDVVQGGCKETTLCLEDKTSNTSTSLGNQKSMIIEPSKIGATYDIVYSFSSRTSRIGLICTEHFNETILIAKNISNSTNPTLFVFSKNACLLSSPHRKGMSTGGTLVVLLLVGFTVYFAGGAIVLYCIRGARGREMIPNLDFWQNLPGLVKDGLIFMLNGCRPIAIPTAESYDRI